DRLPQRRTIVQVVGDDGAVTLGGLHGLDRDLRRGRGERSKNSARVEPAGAELGKNFFPIDVAGLELGNGGVATVVGAKGGTDAEAAFGEVEAVARSTADAVVGYPSHERWVDSALIHEILEQATYGVVGEGCDHGGLESEATFQAAGDVVFAAALAD